MNKSKDSIANSEAEKSVAAIPAPMTPKKHSGGQLKEAIESMIGKNYAEDLFERADSELVALKGAARNERFAELRDQLALACGVVRPHMILETVHERYRPLLASFADQLIAEYECTTPSQKALAETCASAYVRYIVYTKRSDRCWSANAEDGITPALTQFLGMLSKQIDSEQRQFMASLSMLKQIKMPPLSVTVTANTALIAQNQQINAAPTKS